MRRFGPRILLAVLALAAGVTLAWQRFETAALRRELATVQIDLSELRRIQSENTELRRKQVSASELEQLRSDHAAIPRLRAELNALRSPPRN